MKKIKFSIIVPMYNIENYIEMCLKSIVSQTYDNYEVIVVDDGSTDKSNEVAHTIVSDKIKIIKKKNGGLSDARNFGLKYATGDYLWFIDGDDYIEIDALEKIAKKLNEKIVDVVCFSYFNVHGNKKEKFIDRILWENEEYLPMMCVSAWSKVYNKDFFIKNKFEFAKGLIYEDLEIVPYILCKAKSISYIYDELYNYVFRDNSIMNQKNSFKPNRDDKFIVLDRLISKFKNDNLYIKYKEQLEYLAIRHLILVYTTEILNFDREIYKPRCDRVLDYLTDLNKNWDKNKYIGESPKKSIIYIKIFKNKLYFICRLLLNLKH